jgi:uncharacterized protein (TIGR02145 family)
MRLTILNVGYLICLAMVIVFFNSCGKGNTEPPPDPRTYDKGVVINGIKWATRNVDAPGTFVADPKDIGMYYQWNRKKAWPLIGNITDWNTSAPEGDTWEKDNDPCPKGWRVPTYDELQSLMEANSEWTTIPTKGRIFGSGNNTIFLPITLYRHYTDGSLVTIYDEGNYWSSRWRESNGTAYAYDFLFNNDILVLSTFSCNYGFCVRCVAE